MNSSTANFVTKTNIGWDLALDLRERKDYNNSASRMYYSVFQAVLYYAIKTRNVNYTEKQDDRHSRMAEVVKQAFPAQKYLARDYQRLRNLRNKADYDPEDVTGSEFDHNLVSNVQSIREFCLKEMKK